MRRRQRQAVQSGSTLTHVRRLEASETLQAISHTLTSPLDPTEVLRRTIRELTRALDADTGSVWRVDAERDRLVAIAGYRVPKDLEAGPLSVPLLRRHPLVQRARRRDGPIYSADRARDPAFDYPFLRALPHRSVLICPMRAKGRAVGMFILLWTRPRDPFTTAELRLVESIGRQTALAIENSDLLAQMQGLNAELERRVADRTSLLQSACDALHRSREELRGLSRHLQDVREAERAHIAREIHDDLGQRLTALRIDLARLALQPRGGERPLADRVHTIAMAVEDTIGVVRRIATELRPGVLDAFGLVAALRWQMQEFRARTGLRCRLFCHRSCDPVDRERSTALFRIFQEALTNVVRHAEATEVRARLTRTGSTLVLRVSDNGRGIRADAPADRPPLGLVGMRERAGQFGGAVTIESAPGRGTAVQVTLPVNAPSSRP
jgi:signal transduction histidine kinase